MSNSAKEDVEEAVSVPTAPSADFIVDEVRVRGFRSLASIDVQLASEVTYLVGENNAGKSSFLLAVATACGNRRAVVDDLYRSADGARANEANIDLIVVSRQDEFREEVGQRLSLNAGPGPRPGEWMGIRTRLVPSGEGPILTTNRTHLQWDASEESWLDTGTPVSPQVFELLTARLVEASRDLTDDLANRTSDWGRLLSDLGIADADRSDLEADLDVLGGRLRDASPVFGQLQNQLADVAQAQSGIDELILRALPLSLEEVARSVEIEISNTGRAGLPLRFQGLGSRSLAALIVFRTLTQMRVGADQGVRPHIITLLEEPEAHLHPQAQAAVGRLIREMPGQAVVVTHSPIIVAETDPRTVRMMRIRATGVDLHSLGAQTAKKLAVFRRYIERPLGELFFARMVVFVDGTAERIALPILLRPLLGKDPSGEGVTFVDMEGMQNEQCKKVIEALEELGGIPWVFFVDNDGPGLEAIEGLIGSDGKKLSVAHDQVVVSGKKQLEQLLIDSRYTDEIESVANDYLPYGEDDPNYGKPRLPPYTDEDGPKAYLRFLAQNKGWAAELVARAAMENGKEPPEPVIELGSRIKNALGLK